MIAGRHSKARDLVWPRADALVWLDLPLTTVPRRSAVRGLCHWFSGEQICNSNRQRLWVLVNGRDSLLGYVLRAHHRRRADWPQALRLAEHCHARVFR